MLLELGWGEGLLDGALSGIISVRTSDSFGRSPAVRSRGRLIACARRETRCGNVIVAHLFVAVSDRHDVVHPLRYEEIYGPDNAIPSVEWYHHLVERLAPRLDLPA